MPKYESSVFRSEFKTLKFSKDLSIILEKTDDIDLDSLKIFLDDNEYTKKPLQFGSCIKFIFYENEIAIRGYRLNDSWIASEMSSDVHIIPIWASIGEVLLTLEYFYHMSTVI
jgi:hypothetical protein